MRSTNLDKEFCIFVKIQEDNWNMSKIVIIKWLTNNVFYGRLITQLVEYSADNWEVSSSSLLKPTPYETALFFDLFVYTFLQKYPLRIFNENS